MLLRDWDKALTTHYVYKRTKRLAVKKRLKKFCAVYTEYTLLYAYIRFIFLFLIVLAGSDYFII